MSSFFKKNILKIIFDIQNNYSFKFLKKHIYLVEKTFKLKTIHIKIFFN
jgi:hypothetical protein